jgi:hypothetical protein
MPGEVVQQIRYAGLKPDSLTVAFQPVCRDMKTPFSDFQAFRCLLEGLFHACDT